MMAGIFGMFKDVITYCISWTTSLFETMGASDYVLAGFIFAIVVSMFLIPLRGSSAGLDTSFVGDFVRQTTYTPKHWNGRVNKPKAGYKGKYETRKQGGHRASPK